MDTTSKNVLIVEDDMIIAMVLERMVSKLNYNVLQKVINGREAIDITLKEKPDLILMDIQLNDDIDGIHAMRKIRESSSVPVIYITGNSDEYNLQRARETNYVDYLIKPIQLGDLKKSIAKAFNDSA